MAAVERIVVQISHEDKETLAAKARQSDIPLSELMRRAAFAYSDGKPDDELGALADAAKAAAERAGESIDRAVALVEASEKRMAKMESRAAAQRTAPTAG